MNYLKLIRLPNLLIIALTQYLIRYTIIIPILTVYGLTSSLSEINFFLIVLSTILIAAGGYIINDYHDQQIDLINKPERVIIGKTVSKKQGIIFYAALSATGIAIGIYLSFVHNVPLIWQINFISAALLWLYSSMLKKIFLIGNVLISLLSSLSLLIIFISEKIIQTNEVKETKYLIIAYSIFGFIMTWIREVIKDLEDKEGDLIFDRKTLPIVAGEVFSKWFAVLLIFVVLYSLMFIQYKQQQWHDKISFAYVIAGIELPLIVLFVLLLRANTKKQYTVSSRLTKVIMVTGILSMLVFYLRYK
jgi:4-hydroxybenzoate polyprenyltransferase